MHSSKAAQPSAPTRLFTHPTLAALRTTLTINSANRTINQLNTLLAEHPTTLEYADFVFTHVRDSD